LLAHSNSTELQLEVEGVNSEFAVWNMAPQNGKMRDRLKLIHERKLIREKYDSIISPLNISSGGFGTHWIFQIAWRSLPSIPFRIPSHLGADVLFYNTRSVYGFSTASVQHDGVVVGDRWNNFTRSQNLTIRRPDAGGFSNGLGRYFGDTDKKQLYIWLVTMSILVGPD
jgi:hypothetical protein